MNNSARLQIRPNDLAFLPPDMAAKIESAVWNSLAGRWYAEPHSDAFISGIPQIEGAPDEGYRITVDVTVTVYPSAEEMRRHFEGGYAGIFRDPQPRDITHTVEVRL